MKSSLIRDLARRYAAGELSLDEYRTQRRDLVDAITTGKRQLEYGEPALGSILRTRFLWLIAIPLVLAVTAGIVTSRWLGNSHAPQEQAHTSPATGPTLIRKFIEANDWSDTSLEHFMHHWQALSAREQRAARHSYLFPRLAAQLQEQIISQKAMIGLTPGTGKTTTAHLARLQRVAATLGVNLGNGS
ncbi:MAG: hypothetical protein ACYDB9_04295 [Gammaproteobacteria bacterium]